MENKALNIISGILFWIGWLIIAIAIIVSMASFKEAGLLSILIGLGITLGGILFIAFSELIKLLIRIEYNTRKENNPIINPNCKIL